MPEPGRVLALILAGGRSRRMGSDKPLLTLNGETLLRRAVRFWQARTEVDAVLAAVGERGHLSTSLPEGVTPVYDIYPGCGPMAGLHAAFTQTDAELLYVSAVDMPFLTAEALPPLPEGDAAVYIREGRPEPLFGAYRRTLLPALTAALEAGRYKLSDLLSLADTTYLPLPDKLRPALENINTLPDYLRALAGDPPAVCCMGWSGSGKTTFLEKLLPVLTARGLRVSVIKHDAHGFELDRPGKDTWRFRQAGAAAAAISGPNGWAVMSPEDISLAALRKKLPPCDLILVEGHKGSPLPKFEVFRAASGKPLIPGGPELFALVSDDETDTDLPRFPLADAEGLADLLQNVFLSETKKVDKTGGPYYIGSQETKYNERRNHDEHAPYLH